MTNDPLFLLAAGASLAVLLILALGLASFTRGGENSSKNSNKLMQMRIVAQFIAVILIVLFVYIRRTTGG